MLEANKSKIFEKAFSFYNTNLLRRHFDSFYINGLKSLTNFNSSLPLIIYANHSSWWDGLVAFQISQQVGFNSYVMMEEKQLRNLFLFRKLGAFSINREKNRSAVKSLNYAAQILDNSTNVLWIFPQGEILPNDVRPFQFFRGITKIIEKLGKCLTLCITFRYEFLGEYKPQIFANIGNIEESSSSKNFDLRKHFENQTTKYLDILKRDILLQNFDRYQNII